MKVHTFAFATSRPPSLELTSPGIFLRGDPLSKDGRGISHMEKTIGHHTNCSKAIDEPVFIKGSNHSLFMFIPNKPVSDTMES
mmetsp:Transcript_25960/g.53096  ORF Transcript_25960/g.53096 Transcript_25960/m.53096 type:complete len:83 (-) Transcript_25960:491-739(-)